MDKATPTEMGRFEFTEGSELFLDAQYMSAFVWLKQFNVQEEWLFPYCLESAGLVNRGGLLSTS